MVAISGNLLTRFHSALKLIVQTLCFMNNLAVVIANWRHSSAFMFPNRQHITETRGENSGQRLKCDRLFTLPHPEKVWYRLVIYAIYPKHTATHTMLIVDAHV